MKVIILKESVRENLGRRMLRPDEPPVQGATKQKYFVTERLKYKKGVTDQFYAVGINHRKDGDVYLREIEKEAWMVEVFNMVQFRAILMELELDCGMNMVRLIDSPFIIMELDADHECGDY